MQLTAFFNRRHMAFACDRRLVTETLRVMKVMTAIILGLCLQVSATGISQNVSFSGNNVSLNEVINSVKEQTGLMFIYSDQKMKKSNPVSIDVKQVSVQEFLSLVFAEQPLSFNIKGNTVFIGDKKKNKDPSIIDELVPPITIKGKIVNEKGEPVTASIMIRGTKKGTTSDAEGFFVLNNVDENGELIISATNIETVIVPVNNKTSLNISVKMNSSSLNEVIVNKGYYTEKQKFNTGSVANVAAKDIERQPVTSPLMALQGRMAGVDVSPPNGVAGGAPNIVVRGRNSISNRAARPLYIIDGIPIDPASIKTANLILLQGEDADQDRGFDPLNTLNPANIETISVLKDADATAIYGSRGANGVVLITTKRGNISEKTNIDINLYSGAGKIPRFVDLMNTREYLDIRREAFTNDNVLPTAVNAPELIVWDTTRYTNWQQELLGTAARITDVQVNVSSGNKNTSFRFGGAYHKEGMIAPGDFGFQRATGNFNINHTSPNKKFRTSVTVNYGITKNKLFGGVNVPLLAITLPPNAPALFDNDGNLNWVNFSINPAAGFKRSYETRGSSIILSNSVEYELLPGLTARLNMGYNTIGSHSVSKNPLSSVAPELIGPVVTSASSRFSNTERNSWIIEPQLTYQKTFNDHQINIVAGTTWQQNKSADEVILASGYTSDLLLGTRKGATEVNYDEDNSIDYRYMAVFARIGYIYKDKYLLNLTGRRDGSSRFGSGHRWGNFGAIGAGWIFTEENFMKSVNLISFGKIRASYGITGSDQVGDYQYISTRQYTSNLYDGQIGLAPSGLTNNIYAWEQTAKLEAAIELGFLQDRIRVEGSFYRNRCSNQLLSQQLPGTAGFSGVTENLNATVQNTGLELSVQTVNISRKKFQWTSTFNITKPTNKLISYPGLAQSADANTYIVGKSLNIIRLYNYIGVNPTTGFYQVEDVDGNGEFDIKDMTGIALLERRWYGGLTNTITYAGIELSFLFQFAVQTSKIPFYALGFPIRNLPKEVVNDHWRKQGDITKYQKASISDEAGAASSRATSSNASLDNNSFARLKTLSVSYSLPVEIINKASLERVKLFLQAQNLGTISKSKKLDPETGYNALPPQRMITLGIVIGL